MPLVVSLQVVVLLSVFLTGCLYLVAYDITRDTRAVTQTDFRRSIFPAWTRRHLRSEIVASADRVAYVESLRLRELASDNDNTR